MLRQAMLLPAVLLFVAQPARSDSPSELTDSQCLRQLHQEADAVRPLVKSPLAQSFLDAVAHLPVPSKRTLYQNAEKQYVPADFLLKMSESEKQHLKPTAITEQTYYYTKYGTPLAYVRVVELLGQAGVADMKGKRTLDYGYGTVGHLRLLASMGADAVGVDVDPFLPALYYRPEDQGSISIDGKTMGSVTLVDGRWPGDSLARKRVGEKFDLITSKNTLKNGYLHPERKADPRMLIDLGVPDEKFVLELYDALKPGGHLMIYNICPAPAPADKPYIPWADGRCPFPRKLLESTGFKVIDFDRDDSKAVREMAHAFGWDRGDYKMDLEKDLFAHYTLLEKAGK